MHKVLAKNILSHTNGMNIYRGCSHGCIYCDSRSLCYNMDHDFEDIEVKTNAPDLLEDALKRKRNKCMIGTGSMTDPYIHLEETLGNTRKCLEIIEEYGFGLAIQTKSNRLLRDLDILKAINKKSKCIVQVTMTTYDDKLCSILEPNVCVTSERFEMLKILKDNGIETVVWLCPILPFINDTKENIEGLMKYIVEAQVKGIICFGMGLTLREGNRDYFYKKLDENFKGMRNKYQQKYGNSYEIVSDNNTKLMKIIYDVCKNNEIMINNDKIFEYMHTYEDRQPVKQMSIFDFM